MIPDKEEDKDEVTGAERLTVKTEGTEEEVAERLKESFEMEVDTEGEG